MTTKALTPINHLFDSCALNIWQRVRCFPEQKDAKGTSAYLCINCAFVHIFYIRQEGKSMQIEIWMSALPFLFWHKMHIENNKGWQYLKEIAWINNYYSIWKIFVNRIILLDKYLWENLTRLARFKIQKRTLWFHECEAF